MSFYEYYEFLAIDRPLDQGEMKTLRRSSSRARISPSGFVNDYAYGAFRGNEDAWMERYFDAFLYLSNSGDRALRLRLPKRVLAVETARLYASGETVHVQETAEHVIVTLRLEDPDGGEWVEGEGVLGALAPVRAELARGNLRALYLGWLAAAQYGELDDDILEPPVPPGLGEPTAALAELVEFLEIEPDLLAVAATRSGPGVAGAPDETEVRAWVHGLAREEQEDLLVRLILGREALLGTELLRRVAEACRDDGEALADAAERRTVGQLLAAADEAMNARMAREAEREARAQARRDREAAALREKHLDRLASREGELWGEVEACIAERTPKSYAKAVSLVVDLRDLSARAGGGDFDLRLGRLVNAHAKKKRLLERLDRAGLAVDAGGLL